MHTFSPLVHEDLDIICALEQACFTSPWSREIIAAVLDSPYHRTFKLIFDGVIAAYAVIEIEAAPDGCTPEWSNIQSLAVAPEFRRRGYGEILLTHIIKLSQNLGLATIFLEVRTSNTAARSLYEKHDFIAVGVRKDYYRHPTEDAVVMVLR